MKPTPMAKLMPVLLALFLADPARALDELAERYVHLALELGEYDADYVDAYLGPPEWREQAHANARPKEALATDIARLLAELQAAQAADAAAHRLDHLQKRVRAMDARIRMAMGETFGFAEEARLIYDAEIPDYDDTGLDQVLAEIDALVPGQGDLAERVDAFRARYDLPRDRVEAVFEAAVAECRRRTAQYIELPEGEQYTLELVTGTSWGGYNWYQGDNHSLMQLNLDFPLKVDQAVGLGCHEGYPGHHVWNLLVENRLLKEKGWIEYSVFPLYDPSALIAEGSGNYGVDLAFPGDDKLRFEQAVLYPLAGLDPALAPALERLDELTRKLAPARIATARRYLDGEISRDQAIERTRKYGLTSRAKAEKSVRFVEQYRSYVLNYSLGQDLVKHHVESVAGDADGRWQAFRRLLIEMPTASELAGSPPRSATGNGLPQRLR